MIKYKNQWEFLTTPIKRTCLIYVICLQTSTWYGNYWREDKINELTNLFKKRYELSSKEYEQERIVSSKREKNCIGKWDIIS